MFSLHLSPHGSWGWLALTSLLLLALALWAYRFALPPLSPRLRAWLTAARALVLLGLLWLLAQPVLERPRPGMRPRVVVLVDRSASMALPGAAAPRAHEAEQAADALVRALRGRATVSVLGFGAHLVAAGEPDSTLASSETALGQALTELSRRPEAEDLGAVVVVGDGVVNAGPDPLAAGGALGVPVHALWVGGRGAADRAVMEIESSPTGRVGEPLPLRVNLTSDEPRGSRLVVRVLDGGREAARAEAVAPGPGAQATVELKVTPGAPGLALYTAQLDSLPGELTALNNARSAAVEVMPGRLGVVVLSAGLNWDLTLLRRALLGDSALAVRTWVRGGSGWRSPDAEARAGTPPTAVPEPADLRRAAVVVLDALPPETLGSDLQRALGEALRGGAGLLLLGGEAPPGLVRYRNLVPGESLVPPTRGAPAAGAPQPDPGAHDLLAWDDDPGRGERAWRGAAPLSQVVGLAPGPGDRVLLRSVGEGSPLLFARHVARGQVLFVNGAGFWRWALAAGDEQAPERSVRLWRRLIRWLAEPAQGEPLRVRPERLLTPRGERPRLLAELQDAAFRPVTGARVEAQVWGALRAPLRVTFDPQSPGAYAASLPELPPGRYQVSARAVRGGAELGRAQAEFAVDRWSLEEARAQPDSATLARLADATGGSFAPAAAADRWARRLATRVHLAGRTVSVRLWEWPWTFVATVGVLGLEWITRRRRGLP